MVSETGRRRGIELFNAGEFYECHEVLEDAWRPSRGAERFFLQALIHFAVGFIITNREPRGAELQLRKALSKLPGISLSGRKHSPALSRGQAAPETVPTGLTIPTYPQTIGPVSPGAAQPFNAICRISMHPSRSAGLCRIKPILRVEQHLEVADHVERVHRKEPAINSFFSIPTPCSPVIDPPTEMQYVRISSPACCAFSRSPG
jgi:hypothetical protein